MHKKSIVDKRGPCPTCNDLGTISLGNEIPHECPDCHGTSVEGGTHCIVCLGERGTWHQAEGEFAYQFASWFEPCDHCGGLGIEPPRHDKK